MRLTSSVVRGRDDGAGFNALAAPDPAGPGGHIGAGQHPAWTDDFTESRE